jgi:hypothetical protein
MAILIGSKKELGWFATIKNGPSLGRFSVP